MESEPASGEQVAPIELEPVQTGQPSAEDLDHVAEEQKAVEATAVPAAESAATEKPREFTDDELAAIEFVESRGYAHEAAIGIVDQHGAEKILATRGEASGVCKVLTPVLKDGKRFEPGDLIIVSRKQAEQLVAAKSIRYLTAEERYAAEKAREEQK